MQDQEQGQQNPNEQEKPAITPEQLEEIKRVVPDPRQKWESNAHIELEQSDGTVKEITCLRSTAEVLRVLAENTRKDDPKQLELKTKVYVNSADRMDPESEAPIRHIMAEGMLGEVALKLTMASVHPQVVCMEFARMCEFFCARSALKGAIITLISGDAQPSGFGYMSGYATLTPADIGVLGASAAAQVAMFKDEMRKQYPLIRFADDDDKSRIIIPGQ